MERKYVLDTNVLIHNYRSLRQFENIILPMVVLEELDHLKTKEGDTGFNARKAIKEIEKSEHIEFVCTDYVDNKYFPWLDTNRPDNKIILTAKNHDAILVSNDINVRIKAKINGIEAIEYKEQKEKYTGYKEFSGDTEFINTFYENVNDYGFLQNQYIILNDTSLDETHEYRWDNGELTRLKLPSYRGIPKHKQIKGMNPLQRCALDLMNNHEIPIKLILGGYGCVDADTEYFNGEEWIKISEYKKGDMVLEYNEKKQEAILSEPITYHKYKCDKMWNFKTQYGVNQCISDEHDVAYITSKGNFAKKNAMEFIKMHNNAVKGFNGKFITTFNYNGTGIDLNDSEIKLMCAVICDGTFPYNNKELPSYKECRFHIKKDRKKIELEKIFNECSLEWRKHISVENGYVDYYVKDVPRREKEFSSYWYNCNSNQLKIICDNILFWDGSINKTQTGKERKSFSTSIKQNADFIQFAFSATGKRATISINDRMGQKYLTCGKEYIRKSIDYTVVISSNNLIGIQSRKDTKKVEINEYKTTDGFKYCFTMPTGNLILRRDNKIFITGNSGKTYLSVRMALYFLQSKGDFSKILCLREPVGEGKEIGYLKGTKDDKTADFFKPIEHSLDGGEIELEQMVRDGSLGKNIPYFIKGCTFNDTIILVDEAEDIHYKQLKLIGTRLGQNSCVYFMGDYKQSIYDVSETNGLVKLAEKLKGNPSVGIITLNEDVRSPASKIFADLD